jgi:peptidoglycan/xylan/chitin deacetylase (PgdA/CDA1 family)
MELPRLVSSTSWDDGDPRDLRLAEQLVRHGLRGTFYICRARDGHPRLSDAQIRELAGLPEVEIGSHTLTHTDLRRLNPQRVDLELRDSKAWLEDLIGEPVTSFCYPYGSHQRSIAGQVAAAGYLVGRTTMSGHTDVAFDPLRMPTTMQLYPHTKWTQVRHALKERDVSGLRSLLSLRRWSHRPTELAQRFVDLPRSTTAQPAVLHIWGHSWEVDEVGLWRPLEDLLRYLCDSGAVPATNRELAELTHQGKG